MAIHALPILDSARLNITYVIELNMYELYERSLAVY